MTSHNKGKHYINCKECKRKRYCSKASIPNFNFRWTCSKGHIWIGVGFTLERMRAIMEGIMSPEKLKSLFERDDTFYKEISK